MDDTRQEPGGARPRADVRRERAGFGRIKVWLNTPPQHRREALPLKLARHVAFHWPPFRRFFEQSVCRRRQSVMARPRIRPGKKGDHYLQKAIIIQTPGAVKAPSVCIDRETSLVLYRNCKAVGPPTG